MDDLTAEEIRKIRELSIELLDTLAVTLQTVLAYANQHNIPVPQNLSYLIGRTTHLIQELENPHRGFNTENKHPKNQQNLESSPPIYWMGCLTP